MRGPSFAVLAAIALIAPRVRADNASLAEALFREARQAMRAGDYAAACPKLVESQRLDPSPGTRLNLAVCEEQTHLLASAWAQYRAVADELPASDPRAAAARERAAALEPRVPKIRVVLPPGATDVPVDFDATTLSGASVGEPLPVDPGDHVIVIHTPSGPRNMALSLGEGDVRDVTVDPEWLRPAPGATVSPQEPRSGARREVGWAAFGVGGAGVVASLVLGALVLHEKSEVAQHCQGKQCDSVGLSAGRSGTTFATAATASFIVGAASVAGGMYLVLGATSPRAAVTPSGATLALGGVF